MVLRRKDLSGVFNVVSPQILSIHDFFLTVAEVCSSRIWLAISPWLLGAVMGESSVILIRGQRVVPKRLKDYGFIFGFNSLRLAIIDLYSRRSTRLREGF
jgi:hypothetical protein